MMEKGEGKKGKSQALNLLDVYPFDKLTLRQAQGDTLR